MGTDETPGCVSNCAENSNKKKFRVGKKTALTRGEKKENEAKRGKRKYLVEA